MKVSDIMSRQIAVIPPDTSLQEAARIMRDLDVGFLPVAQEGKLVGVITDRDIACRAVATGVQPATAIGHTMTKGVMHLPRGPGHRRGRAPHGHEEDPAAAGA